MLNGFWCLLSYSWYDSNPLARVVQASPEFSAGAWCQTKRLFKCHKRMVGTHARASSQHHQGMYNKCLLAERWELHRITSKSGWPAVNGSLHVHFYIVQFHKASTSNASFWSSSVSVQWPSHVPKLNSVKINCAAYLSMGSTTPPCDPKKTMIMDGFSEMFEGTNPFFPLDLGTRRCGLWMSGKDTVPVSILWRVTERLAKPNMLRDRIYFIVKRWNNLGLKSTCPWPKKEVHIYRQVPSHVFWKACATLCCLSLRFSFLSTIKATWWWNVWWP